MAYIDDINYKETILKHRIVLKSNLFDLVGTILFFIITSFFIVCLFLTYKEANLSNPNDNFVAFYILPCAGLFALILLYKKVREKRLMRIDTTLSKVKAREKIVSLANSWGWNIVRNNGNYLQATTGFNLTWGKQIIIIYQDDKIYLNVMSDNPTLRMPVLFSDNSIKQDIKKGIQASN